MKNYIRKAQLQKKKEHLEQESTKYCCKKCNFTWIETDPKIIKVWCPKCNLIMIKNSNAGNKYRPCANLKVVKNY